MIPLDGSNLVGWWNTVWSAFTAAVPKATMIMGIVAVLALVYAIGKWFWQHKSGLQGGNNSHVWGSLVLAGVLSLPGVVIPLLLALADLIINFVAKVGSSII